VARTKERRLITLMAQHGEPFEPRPEGTAALGGEGDPGRPLRFGEAVSLFRNGKAISRLKPSTWKGYQEVLSKWLLPRFGKRPLEAVTEVTQRGISVLVLRPLSSSLVLGPTIGGETRGSDHRERRGRRPLIWGTQYVRQAMPGRGGCM